MPEHLGGVKVDCAED